MQNKKLVLQVRAYFSSLCNMADFEERVAYSTDKEKKVHQHPVRLKVQHIQF